MSRSAGGNPGACPPAALACRSCCPSCVGRPSLVSHSFTVLSVEPVASRPAAAPLKHSVLAGFSCAASVHSALAEFLRAPPSRQRQARERRRAPDAVGRT